MIIALSGKSRVGKDTTAVILKDLLGEDCQCIAYADYLKEIIMNCFGLSLEEVYGSLKEECIEGLPIRTRSGNIISHNWTPRKLLQYLGTDIFRTIDPDCWLNVVKNKVLREKQFSNYIITDSRFPNEISWVLEAGGIHIRIDRANKDFVGGADHVSENSLPEFIEGPNSFLIHNDKDLTYLSNELVEILNTWRNTKWQTKSMH